jgi:hypothetical protein
MIGGLATSGMVVEPAGRATSGGVWLVLEGAATFGPSRAVAAVRASGTDEPAAHDGAVPALSARVAMMLPEQDQKALSREFEHQRAKWLKNNEWARPFFDEGAGQGVGGPRSSLPGGDAWRRSRCTR